MNKTINYYDILKRIKCNKVRKVIKLMITSQQSLKYYLKQCNIPKSTFFDIVSNIISDNELKLINGSRTPKKLTKYTTEIIFFLLL